MLTCPTCSAEIHPAVARCPRCATVRAPELSTRFHVVLILAVFVSFLAFLAWAGPTWRRVADGCAEWRELPPEATDAVPRRECVRWKSGALAGGNAP